MKHPERIKAEKRERIYTISWELIAIYGIIIIMLGAIVGISRG